MRRYLRFADLQQLGIVSNRTTLGRWLREQGFPRPFKLGPNAVAWDEQEVREWVESRREAA